MSRTIQDTIVTRLNWNWPRCKSRFVSTLRIDYNTQFNGMHKCHRRAVTSMCSLLSTLGCQRPRNIANGRDSITIFSIYEFCLSTKVSTQLPNSENEINDGGKIHFEAVDCINASRRHFSTFCCARNTFSGLIRNDRPWISLLVYGFLYGMSSEQRCSVVGLAFYVMKVVNVHPHILPLSHKNGNLHSVNQLSAWMAVWWEKWEETDAVYLCDASSCVIVATVTLDGVRMQCFWMRSAGQRGNGIVCKTVKKKVKNK